MAEALKYASAQPEFLPDGVEFMATVNVRPIKQEGVVRGVGVCVNIGSWVGCFGVYEPHHA